MAGLWAPAGIQAGRKTLYYSYTFVLFMFLLGTFIILQVIELCLIWGNLSLMTGTALVLFTNISQAMKIVNLLARRKHIEILIKDANDDLEAVASARGRELVKSCDDETRLQQIIFLSVTFITVAGWAASAEKNKLPLPAWYPYETASSPAYQLTYTHQIVAIVIVAVLNISKDSLVTTLLAQTRCRLGVVGLALSNVCNGFISEDHYNYPRKTNKILTAKQDAIVKNRLRICVQQHQRALEAVQKLQDCFSEPTFAQFIVSLIIICVTEFQVLSQTGNLVRMLPMTTYLLNMILQVFLYCYQGHNLTVESEELVGAIYEMPWYMCSVSIRRSILIMMRRCHRTVKFTAGGFTTLSLATFTSVIKLSYSMFTLLQQVNEKY